MDNNELTKALGQRLAELAAHADALSQPPAQENSDPYAVIMPFVDSAYAHAWVLDDFDWATWEASTEANALQDDPQLLAAASAEQLARILTALIRGDRVQQGRLEDAYENGLLADCAKRAASLAAE